MYCWYSPRKRSVTMDRLAVSCLYTLTAAWNPCQSPISPADISVHTVVCQSYRSVDNMAVRSRHLSLAGDTVAVILYRHWYSSSNQQFCNMWTNNIFFVKLSFIKHIYFVLNCFLQKWWLCACWFYYSILWIICFHSILISISNHVYTFWLF